jgi:hypothetical protein
MKTKSFRIGTACGRIALVRRSFVAGALAFVVLAAAAPFVAPHHHPVKSTNPTATNDIVQFTSGGHVLGFAQNGVYAATGSHALRVEFVNAHPTSPASAVPSTAAKSDKKAVPLSQVTYPNLWDGVTLTYDAPKGAIARSTYRLEPYAKTANIRLRYNAPIAVQHDGSLRISFQTGALNESAPQAWQERDGKRAPVRIAFASRGEHEIGFAVGEYDRSEPLIIDPTLTWNTFLGGSGNDHGYGVAVDGSGNVYVAGTSDATWGSPVRAFSGTSGTNNAFAAKLDSTGNLTWNTFLGSGSNVSSDSDGGNGVAVDGSGNVYVVGYSTATWGSPVRPFATCNGCFPNAFVAKLSSTGTLTWNTFLGSYADFGNGVAVDGSRNVYVTGQSFTTWGSPVRPHDTNFTWDAFAAKLDASGNLTWNTFLGGFQADYGNGVAVDGSGNVYVVGFSGATWGSPVSAYSGGNDAFAAKLDASGNLTWNTFLGSSNNDYSSGVAVDGSGNVYVIGNSDATWGSPVSAFNGNSNAFAAKLSSTGTLTWNTFLGGYYDYGRGVAVDGSGNVYVTGYSIETWGSPVRAYSGGNDAFAAQLLSSTGSLIWNTFLGGSGDDYGYGVAADGSGNVYVAGYSTATWGSPVRAFRGGDDAFVAKISPNPVVTTNPATNVASFSATLNGSLNPRGSTTTVYFQYGPTTSYGSTTPMQTQTGNTVRLIGANISGLMASHVYHFRIVAHNSAGTSFGSDRTFTTLSPTGPPAVITSPATLIASFSATLNGSLDPHGLTTSVHFQYGTTTSYGLTTAPQSHTGNTYLNISANISGLFASHVYHFRIVATNSAGTTFGGDRTFTTLSATGAPVVTTNPATNVTSSLATLNGLLDPHGLTTTVHYQYGTTTSYGLTTAPQSHTGNTYLNVSANIGGLSASHVYHFRIVATNSAGTRYGSDRTFTTP